MALGEFKWFQFKSRKQVEKEAKQYAEWAFPYGDMQKDKVSELLCALKPKETTPIKLASFLTCKELYESVLEDSESREEAVNRMVNVVKSYNQLIRKEDMNMYLAIVLADADIDESCNYPSVDEINVRIQELNDLRTSVKKKKK